MKDMRDGFFFMFWWLVGIMCITAAECLFIFNLFSQCDDVIITPHNINEEEETRSRRRGEMSEEGERGRKSGYRI